MKDKEQQYEIIENYLLSRLSQDQKNDFEMELRESTLLHEELNLHKSLHETLADEDLLLFRGRLKETITAEKSTQRTKIKGLRSPLLLKVAASITLIIGLSFIVSQFLLNLQPSSKKIVMDYFEPYDNLISSRGLSDEKLNRAMFAYDRGNYVEAIALFSNLSDQEYSLIDFYRGVSYLAISDGNEAVQAFHKAKNESNRSLHDAMDWYLSLGYLLEEDLTKSKELLNKLKDGNSVYKEQATTLLKQLE